MVRQSQEPILLLTRPLPQSQRFSAELQAALGPRHILIAPLMAPEFTAAALPERGFAAVIFASETAVAAATRLSDRSRLPQDAFCVGARTAAAARAAGFEPRLTGRDAQALVAQIQAADAPGPLLFLRGADTTGAIEESLNSAMLETHSQIIYRQVPQPLTQAALSALCGDHPVILPLFSPRSARLLGQALQPALPGAPLFVAALSPAVAQAAAPLHPVAQRIAATPDAPAMIAAISALIDASTLP